MDTKTITIRIPEGLAGWLASQGGSMNQTIVDALNGYRYGRISSEKELKGMFCENDWKFLADSLVSSKIIGEMRFNSSILSVHCEESASMEYLAQKWGVDINSLIQKIGGLSGAQVDALYCRVENFWNQADVTNLDEWANY